MHLISPKSISSQQKPHLVAGEFAGSIDFTITNLHQPYNIEALSDKVGFLMISVKNRYFSNRLIEHYCHFVEHHLARGYIVVVDAPYFANISANDLDDATRGRELTKLERISAECHHRVRRILKRQPSGRVEELVWGELERSAPDWLSLEVASAFQLKGRFHRDIIERTRETIPLSMNEHQLETFSQFLVREIPVLCYVYYMYADEIVDVYPGECPDFFWQFERGFYSHELPRISALARRSRGLIYVDFRERPRTGR